MPGVRRLHPNRTMPGFNRLGIACALALLPGTAHAQPGSELPCQEYSQSAAVFVGVAAAPVKRWVQLPDHPPLAMKLTPVTVERAFLGVSTAVMYLMPLGIEQYATPGRKYLVYGRGYHPPDIVMASPGIGAKEIEAAAADLAFLDALAPVSGGGTIAGVVRLRESSYGRFARATDPGRPLGRIIVRLFNEKHSLETVSGDDGGFVASGLPPGTYQLVPQLPDGLVVNDPTSRIAATVRDGGCATTTIDVLFNGRVRGVLRGPDGLPLRSTSVDLMPMDVAQEPRTGQIVGTSSVWTNESGEFEFTGRPAGRYYLGVSLYNAPNPNGPSYPRTYYPGTTDRGVAVPVVVQHGRPSEGFDFSIATILPKGELEFAVDTDHGGQLKFCFVQLEDLFSRWSSDTVKRGVVYRRAVVDGQRYQVHAHLEFPGGHLESEPYVFTATTGKTVVTLRPDAPRELHR